jgi:hypothetical protein
MKILPFLFIYFSCLSLSFLNSFVKTQRHDIQLNDTHKNGSIEKMRKNVLLAPVFILLCRVSFGITILSATLLSVVMLSVILA